MQTARCGPNTEDLFFCFSFSDIFCAADLIHLQDHIFCCDKAKGDAVTPFFNVKYKKTHNKKIKNM